MAKQDDKVENSTRKLRIVGEIDDSTYQTFSESLDELLDEDDSSPIYLELNSEGGDVFAALGIVSKIRHCPCDIIITAYGSVQSAAVLILASGSSRSMAAEAWVMVHEDECVYEGRVTKLEKYAKHQRRMEDQWNQLLEERTTATAETWADLHKKSTHLSPAECLSLGLIDEIV